MPGPPKIPKNKDILDQVGPIHLGYQFLSDGVSDLVWCHQPESPDQPAEFEGKGFTISTQGELLHTTNGGLDWAFVSLQSNQMEFVSQTSRDNAPTKFEVNEIILGSSGVVYFVTECQNLLKTSDCSGRLTVAERVSAKEDYSIKQVHVHASKPDHLLVLIEEISCTVTSQCYFSKVVYYSARLRSKWIRLMEDVEHVVWVGGTRSFDLFGILMVLDESVDLDVGRDFHKKQSNRTEAVYSNNFFIDKYRWAWCSLLPS